MRKAVISIVAATVLLVPAAPAAAQDASVREAIRIQTKYDNLRERLWSCHVDRVRGYLGGERRAACRTLARRYVLYTTYAESSDYQVHCLTRRYCLKTPEGLPRADRAMPRGGTVYRL